MFDIFVYLFENYVQADACPAPDQLALKLSAAGFEEDEISEALEWLSGLTDFGGGGQPRIAAQSHAVRCYSDLEQAKLDRDCRGFLVFLENAGLLDAVTRELVIERAMAIADDTVSLTNFKLTVLMVLWNQNRMLDTLLLEELLAEEEERVIH